MRGTLIAMDDVLEIPCGGCGRALRVAPDHAGKMARCPVCGHITQVPATRIPSPFPASGRELAGEEAPQREGAPGSLGIHKDAAEWYMKTPEEQTFGPASFQDLERWVQEGRITSDCELCQGAAGNWQPADWLFPTLKRQPTFSPQLAASLPAARNSPSAHAPSHYPPPGSSTASATSGTRYVAAHRGALILILGLMGLFIQCPLFPFMSWVMGSNDLRDMEAGRMDPSGRDLTRAGMIVGMILSILWILAFLVFFVMVLIGIAGS
ncbi:MAG: hypothetical protein ACR2FY_12740 [Pirellulaceae bacterium]